MIDIDQYKKLKKAADDAKETANRASAILEDRMKRLKAEYKVESIEEAEKLLTDLTKEEETQEAEYNRLVTEFQSKWNEKL